MVSRPLQAKARMAPTMIARWERLADYCGNFVLSPVIGVVNYSINS